MPNQLIIQTDAAAVVREPENVNKAHTVAASNNRGHTHDHSIITACSHHSLCKNMKNIKNTWPRAPHNTLWRLIVNLKFAKLRRGEQKCKRLDSY